MEVSRREIFRYLGYRNAQPDPETCRRVEDCLQALEQCATPRSLWQECTLAFPEENVVLLGARQIRSSSLARHLQGCHSALLFAATLGAQVDLLLARYTRTEMSRAVILQACAAAMIEAYCDACCASIPSGTWYQKPRYSPGYGDFPLTFQPVLLSMLEAPKRIGLACTESAMLTPAKSVTAVIGLTAESEPCHVAKCARCANTSCPFRKE